MRKVYHIAEVCCRWLLGLVFLYGGVPKLFQLSAFVESVGDFGIVPDDLLPSVALGISLLEVVAGIGIIAGKRLALHLAAIMMVIFIFVLSYGIWLGLDIDCGCFAGDGNDHGNSSSLKEALVRDLFLLLPFIFIYCKSLFKNTLLKEYNIEKS
jgi:uncharacterized membrane protein YphA (DoxX/SURF4 family)